MTISLSRKSLGAIEPLRLAIVQTARSYLRDLCFNSISRLNDVFPFTPQSRPRGFADTRAPQGTSSHADRAVGKNRNRAVRPVPHGTGRIQGRPRHALQDPPGLRPED